MKLIITAQIGDLDENVSHVSDTGLTMLAHDAIVQTLMEHGLDDIEIRRDPSC